MLAMRAYMRAKSVLGRTDESIAARVGLTGAAIEDMYQIMAIANYEDRFVIPTAKREWAENAQDLRGACGVPFGNGCSGGETKINLFSTRVPKAPPKLMKVERRACGSKHPPSPPCRRCLPIRRRRCARRWRRSRRSSRTGSVVKRPTRSLR